MHASSLVCLAVLACGLGLAACDNAKPDPKNSDSTSLGSDVPTVAALDHGGHPIVGVNSLGVSYSEFQDPATGDVFSGVSSTSSAGLLYSLGDRDETRWVVGLPAGVSDPVVAPDGNILITSGHYLLAVADDGTLAWTASSVGSFAVAPSGLIYVATGTALRAIAADGSAEADLVGQTDLPGRAFRDAPSIGPDGTVYFVTVDDPGSGAGPVLRAASPGGALLWSTPLGDAETTAEGSVLVGPDGLAWVNGARARNALLRAFDGKGKEVHTLPNRRLAAIDADGTLYGSADANSLAAFDSTGQTKWATPSGTGSIALLDGGGVMSFETIADDIGDRYYGLRLTATGVVKNQVQIVVNRFVGSPVVRDDGFVFQPGYWANQYPPFNVLVTGFHLSGAAPAAAAWSRTSGDSGNTRAPWPAQVRTPNLQELVGLWSHVDAGTVTALRFGKSDIAFPDLVGVEFPFELWRYPTTAARAVLVARGGADATGDHVTLTPTWGEGAGTTNSLSLGPSDPWSLSMGDPTTPDTRVDWHATLALPMPESPLNSAGRPVWAVADGGGGTTFAYDPKTDRIFIAGSYLSDADSTLGGQPLEEPPCCGHRGTFAALLQGDGQHYDWTYTTTDTVDKVDADNPLGAAFDSTGRPRLLTTPGFPRPSGPGVARLCSTEIWSIDGESHDVAELSILNESPADQNSIEATAYALDAEDGEAIVGVLHGTARFTGGLVLTSSSPSSLFFLRYDPTGHLTIATEIPAEHLQRPTQAIFDAEGNLAIAGTSEKGRDLLVLDPLGNIKLEKHFPTGNNDSVALAVSKSGDFALGGAFDGTIDFGSEVMTVKDPTPRWLAGDAFVARFDRTGGLVWARQIDGAERQIVSALTFDGSDNVVVAGVLGAPLGLDGVTASPILRVYDRCGAELYTRSARYCDACGAPGEFQGNFATVSLFVAANGDLILGGWPLAWAQIENVLVGPPHPDKGSGTGGAFAVLRLSGTPAGVGAPPGACPEAWHDVTVEVPGKAGGRVVSDPPGIDCPGSCRVAFEGLSPVVLTAIAPDGGRFDGWSGACHGNGPCTIVSGTPKAVTARFGKPILDAVEVLTGLPERVVGAAPAGDDTIFVFAPLPGVNNAPIGGVIVPRDKPAGVVARLHGAEVVWAHLLEIDEANGLAVAGAAADPRGGIVFSVSTAGAGQLSWDGVALPSVSGAGPLALISVGEDGALRWAHFQDGLQAGPLDVGPDGTIVACRNAVFDADGAPLWSLDQGTFNAEHCLAMADGVSVFADAAALSSYDRAGAPRWTLPLDVTKISALAPLPAGGFLLAGEALTANASIEGTPVAGSFLLWIGAEGHVSQAVALDELGIHTVSAAVALADGTALLTIAPTDAPVEWLADWHVEKTDELVLVDVGSDRPAAGLPAYGHATVRFATSARMGSEAGAGVILPPGPFLLPASDGRVWLAGGLGGSLDFAHDPTLPVPAFGNAPFVVKLRF